MAISHISSNSSDFSEVNAVQSGLSTICNSALSVIKDNIPEIYVRERHTAAITVNKIGEGLTLPAVFVRI